MKRACQQGFTLVELLVALALTALLGVTIAYTFRVQALTYKTQEEVAALQQSLRSAMLVIEQDLRMAGSDPKDTANEISTSGLDNCDPELIDFNVNRPGILSASEGTINQTAISISMNRHGLNNLSQFDTVIGKRQDRADPNTREPDEGKHEIVQYKVRSDGGVSRLSFCTPNVNGFQPMADGITDLQLAYFDSTNTVISTGDLSDRLNDIRRVRLALTGQTPGGITKTLISDVWLRNMVGR